MLSRVADSLYWMSRYFERADNCARAIDATHSLMLSRGEFTHDQRWYRALTSLGLPSDARETWGLVANEALAAGLPIVVSDAAGCARDLAIGEAGRQYPMGQVSQLAAALTSMAAALDASPRDVSTAVSERSAAFGCDVAVAGVLRAVEVVSRARETDPGGHLAAASAVRRPRH